MRHPLLLLLVLSALFVQTYAQQDPQYTMYNFNRLAVNPAYAGAMEATNITLLGRAQWVGIPGAPKTSTFTGSAFLPGISSGIGVGIIADGLGTLRTIGAGVDYAFHLKLGSSGNTKLNIGVHGGLYQKGLFVPKEGWRYMEQGGIDPLVQAATGATAFVPDIGAGLFLHSKRKNMTAKVQPLDSWFFGASVSHILEPSLKGLFANQTVGVNSRLRRGINAMAGVTIPLNNTMYLQPSAFFRTDLASWQTDLTLNLYISPMVFGLNYRGSFVKNHDSFGGIVGFNANTNLFIGYAYDYTISALTRYTSGSHELIISYTFPNVSPLFKPLQDVRGNSR